MKKLYTLLILAVLCAISDMSAMSRLYQSGKQISPYARQAGQRILSTGQKLPKGTLQQLRTKTPQLTMPQRSPQLMIPRTPQQPSLPQMRSFAQQAGRQQASQGYYQRFMNWLKGNQKSLAIGGATIGAGAYGLSQQQPALAQELSFGLFSSPRIEELEKYKDVEIPLMPNNQPLNIGHYQQVLYKYFMDPNISPTEKDIIKHVAQMFDDSSEYGVKEFADRHFAGMMQNMKTNWGKTDGLYYDILRIIGQAALAADSPEKLNILKEKVQNLFNPNLTGGLSSRLGMALNHMALRNESNDMLQQINEWAYSQNKSSQQPVQKPKKHPDIPKFDRKKMPIDDCDDYYGCTKIEGYWAGSPDPAKDWYKGKFPWPQSNSQPWSTQDEFLKRLARIEKILLISDNIISYRGLSESRFEPGVYVGSQEYIYTDPKTKNSIRWSEAFRPYYVEKFNVIPSQEFYKFVMNHPYGNDDSNFYKDLKEQEEVKQKREIEIEQKNQAIQEAIEKRRAAYAREKANKENTNR